MASFNLSDFAEPVNEGIEFARSFPWWMTVLLATPLAVTVLVRALTGMASIQTEFAVAILGGLGFVGTLAQLIASEMKFRNLDRRTLNGAEVLIPLLLSMGASLLVLLLTLPPSPFNEWVRGVLGDLQLRVPVRGT